MSKKILALMLAVMMLVLSFSACGKKKENIVKAPNGKEYEYVLDENKRPITSGDKIQVYAKDADGKIKKDENGENVKVYIDFPNEITKDLYYETKAYKLELPKTWEKAKEKDEGIYETYQQKENKNIIVTMHAPYNLKDDEKIEDFVENQANLAEKATELLGEGATCTAEIKQRDSFDGKYTCYEVSMSTKDKDGATLEEDQYIYIDKDGVMSYFFFVSQGAEFPEEFDAYAVLQESLTLKDNV